MSSLLLGVVGLGGVSFAEDVPSTTEGARYELAWIEPGQFVMGSPPSEAGRDETQHEVRISRGFYMGVHEVTQGL